MGYSVFPAPAAGSKTAYRTTLTSGTSWTVPTGVTYVNVTLYGGGGGGGAGSYADGNDGGTGGTTTFTGATSASGGLGGRRTNLSQTGGISAQANSYQGGQGSFRDNGGSSNGEPGFFGTIVSSTLSTTPGASIAYAIGAGGTGGTSGYANGGNGGSGKIDIEYWV